MSKKVTKKTDSKKAASPRAKRSSKKATTSLTETTEVATASSPSEEKIRERAYELFRAGANQGDPVANWFQAEHELRTETRV